MRRDDARDQVERDQALGTVTIFVLVTIDGEGDPDPAKDDFSFFAAQAHALGVLLGKPAGVVDVVGANLTQVGGFRQSGIHLVVWAHGTPPAHSLAIYIPRIT